MDIPPMDWTFPPEEQKLIDTLRERVKEVEASPYWKENLQLHRFIMARNKNIDKAEKMYRAAMKWRKEMRADHLLKEYKEPEVLKNYFPHGFLGHDREGLPVMIERAGNIDLPGLRDAVGEEELLRWVAYYHEVQERYMREASLKAKDIKCHKMTVIVDMKGMGVRHLGRSTTSLIKKRTRLEEDNYPEVCRRVLLVRSPSIMAGMWKIVKVFIDKGTRDKIRILGKKYMPTLEQFIDPKYIPGYLGGELKPNGDPECKELMVHGGIVPLKYRMGLTADAETLKVNAGYCYDHKQPLTKGGNIDWVFKVDGDRNIGFAVYFEPGQVKVEEVPVEEAEGNENEEDEKQEETAGRETPTDGTPDAEEKEEEEDTPPTFRLVKRPVQPTIVSDKTAGYVGKEVVENTRVCEADGNYTAPEDGVVTLRFDNTFSWMKAKVVIAEITAEIPQEEIPDELETKKSRKRVVIKKKRSRKTPKPSETQPEAASKAVDHSEVEEERDDE